MTRGKRTRINWKQIAIDLYESAGCGCCSDHEKRMAANSAYRVAVEAESRAGRKA